MEMKWLLFLGLDEELTWVSCPSIGFWKKVVGFGYVIF